MSNTGAPADPAVGEGEFNLEAWAIEHHLTRKTTGALRKEESDTLASLKLITGSDINRMDIAVGQIRLLRTALRVLGNPILVTEKHEEVVPPPHNQQEVVNLENHADADNENVLEGAGQELADLLLGGEEEALGQAEDAVEGRGLLPRLPQAAGGFYDPLIHLTVKATKQKALHIINFLPEATRRRVNQKRREHLTFTTTKDGALALKNEENTRYYITFDEWSGANMRLVAHMITTATMKQRDVIYYLAYTAMISDLASKFEWSSILEYDTLYRELQAEHNFPWGTPHPHSERHILVPRRQHPSPLTKGKPGEGDRPKTSAPLCRDYINGTCNFGSACRYRHVKPTPAVAKNE